MWDEVLKEKKNLMFEKIKHFYPFVYISNGIFLIFRTNYNLLTFDLTKF